MKNQLSIGALHHVMLTVREPERSRAFYTNVLGFEVEAEFDIGSMLNNGNVRLILFPSPNDPIPNDRFDENRIGLQHLAFYLPNHKSLENAAVYLDTHNVPHGLIEDFGPDLGLYALNLRDPDNIRLQLLAPYEENRGN